MFIIIERNFKLSIITVPPLTFFPWEVNADEFSRHHQEDKSILKRSWLHMRLSFLHYNFSKIFSLQFWLLQISFIIFCHTCTIKNVPSCLVLKLCLVQKIWYIIIVCYFKLTFIYIYFHFISIYFVKRGGERKFLMAPLPNGWPFYWFLSAPIRYFNKTNKH